MSPSVIAAGGSAISDYLLLRKKGWSDADASEAVLTGEQDIDRPVSATAKGSQVFYTYGDGSTVVLSGGTQNLRGSNPGNMIDSVDGYKSIRRSASGKFAVFPDIETGFDAEVSNLEKPAYQDKTVLQAVSRWAPKGDDNDPATYARTISSWTGLDVNTPLNQLTRPQLINVANAIQRFEGAGHAAATVVLPSSSGK